MREIHPVGGVIATAYAGVKINDVIPRVYTHIYMVYMPKIAYFCSAVLRAAITQTAVAVRCKTGQSTLIEIKTGACATDVLTARYRSSTTKV